MESSFIKKIEYNVNKKINLIDNNILSYIIRSILAGGFLTITTLAGVYFADGINSVGNYGKPFYAFIFAFGLVYILFLGGELATSNMMYLSAGLYLKKIKLNKVIKILFVCILFNLFGAIIFALLINQTSIISHMAENSTLINIVSVKINTGMQEVLFSSILANIIVNIAILGYLLINESITKTIFVLSAIFMFVLLGMEHVVANFGSFSMILFSKFANKIDNFEMLNILCHWIISFIGNLIGGGLLGLIYAYMNNQDTIYKD